MTDPQPQPILGKAFADVPQPILGKALTADANNRALRTFLVGLAIDVAVAVALAVTVALQDTNGWGDLEWGALGFLVAKTVAMTAGSYILRKKLDASALPTPLPPAPVPEPNEDIQPILGKA